MEFRSILHNGNPFRGFTEVYHNGPPSAESLSVLSLLSYGGGGLCAAITVKVIQEGDPRAVYGALATVALLSAGYGLAYVSNRWVDAARRFREERKHSSDQ